MGFVPVTSDELRLMRKSGQISAKALKKAIEAVKVGVTELEVDKLAGEEIIKLGGDWSYKSVPNYYYATCVTTNEEVVHGIPTGRVIEKGDLVSVDLATEYKGWHTDCAWTVMVGDRRSEVGGRKEKERFLKVGEEALWLGIKQAVVGKRIGDIASAIQTKVEGAGYHVVRSLVGHGVGRHLHEEPEVPGYGEVGIGKKLKKGMTLAIEVIYTMGTPDVKLGADGWTYISADGSLAGLFEMTVVVGKDKAEVLTDWRRV